MVSIWARSALLVLCLGSPAWAQKTSLAVEKATAPLIDAKNVSKPASVTIVLKPEAAEAFAAFTRVNSGRQIRISVADKTLMTPFIQMPITGGTLEISGRFSYLAAGDLAKEVSNHGTIDVEVMTP